MVHPNIENKNRTNYIELSENLTIAPLLRFSCSKKAKFCSKGIEQEQNSDIIQGYNVTYKQRIRYQSQPRHCQYAYIKFGEILSIYSPDIEWK